MTKNDWLKLASSILICEGAGLIGSIFTFSAISTWYATLNKPLLSPPSWLFAPVWTLLYALMGVSLYLIWQSSSKVSHELLCNQHKRALTIFSGQLVLNVLWSIIFFGLKLPAIAFGEIVVMWLLILWTILSFAKISKNAALLLIPYLLWVSFAAYLNYSIWVLN